MDHDRHHPPEPWTTRMGVAFLLAQESAGTAVNSATDSAGDSVSESASGWLAQFRNARFDWPQTGWEWALYGGGFVLAFALVIWLYIRDTRSLSPVWTVWLLMLRLAALCVIVVIALNPHRRTEKQLFRPSRVAIIVDTSASMKYPSEEPPDGTAPSGKDDGPSRIEAIRKLMAETGLIESLQKNHEVSVYTFDSKLKGPLHVYPALNDPARKKAAEEAAAAQKEKTEKAKAAGAAAGNGNSEDKPDAETPLEKAFAWDDVLSGEPETLGLETRLGESLNELIKKVKGKTLSGVVIFSDGGSNAGLDPESARAEARAANVRLVTVGVGSTRTPVNVKVASISAPSVVHTGDPYDIKTFIQGQGLKDRNAAVEVELLMRAEGENVEPVLVEPTPEQPNPQTINLSEDGVPVEVTFQQQPKVAANFEFFIRARTVAGLSEQDDGDNQLGKNIRVIERKTRVLLYAGGPMREYRFVRNMLYRHQSIDVHVCLQTVDPGNLGQVSQESNRTEGPLPEFPTTAAELYEYDVIVAFDPDWEALSPEQSEMLVEWVEKHSGGLILVAADVFTPDVADAGDLQPAMKAIQNLYPVFLGQHLLAEQIDDESDQPWPVEFTPAGKAADFLNLTDDPALAEETWEEFDGVFRSYPTAGEKAAATVYAYFSDPESEANSQYGKHVLMASQFYGTGRTFYLGSPELWRLRALDEEYYDRFWTKLIREIGQGRLKRGNTPGSLLLERTTYFQGQTVNVRANLLNARREPLVQDSVDLDIVQPDNHPVLPPRKLYKDANRPGQFVGDFRASLPGRYRIELAIPESDARLYEPVDVVVPRLESDNTRQDSRLLTNVTRDTGGRYLPLEGAETEIPTLLPAQPETITVDERLFTLWDQKWVMFLLAALFSIEWLTRKLLKLA